MRRVSQHSSIGDLCDFVNGNGFRPPDWKPSGLPIIRIQNLNGSNSFNYFDGEPKQKWIVEPGDLLFAWAGVKGVSFGPTIWPGPRGVLNQHIFRVVPKKGVDKYWLYLALQVATVRIEANAHGFKSSLVHVQKDAITEQTVDLPPLPEQHKIAEILRTWDEAIEKLEALRAANEGRYKALARRFFDPCHPTFHGRPNTWREFELGGVFRERSQSGKENDRLLSITMNGGVIDRDAVGRKDTSTEDKSKYKLILPGDIGYNTMRMWQGVSGLSALRGIISPAYTVVTPIPNRILGRYAAHLFKSRRMVFDFERYSQGLTSDTWNLKFPAFSKIRVFLPPIDDQEKMADTLDALTAEGAVIGKQVEALTRQKRGLMQKLLTGEWRVSP